MEILQFELTVDETNQILSALGDQPFSKVFALINKIQRQAGEQLQADLDMPVVKPSTQPNRSDQDKLS